MGFLPTVRSKDYGGSGKSWGTHKHRFWRKGSNLRKCLAVSLGPNNPPPLSPPDILRKTLWNSTAQDVRARISALLHCKDRKHKNNSFNSAGGVGKGEPTGKQSKLQLFVFVIHPYRWKCNKHNVKLMVTPWRNGFHIRRLGWFFFEPLRGKQSIHVWATRAHVLATSVW